MSNSFFDGYKLLSQLFPAARACTPIDTAEYDQLQDNQLDQLAAEMAQVRRQIRVIQMAFYVQTILSALGVTVWLILRS